VLSFTGYSVYVNQQELKLINFALKVHCNVNQVHEETLKKGTYVVFFFNKHSGFALYRLDKQSDTFPCCSSTLAPYNVCTQL